MNLLSNRNDLTRRKRSQNPSGFSVRQQVFSRGDRRWCLLLAALLFTWLAADEVRATHALSESLGDTIWTYLQDPTRQYMFWPHTSEGIQNSIHADKMNFNISRIDWRASIADIHWNGTQPPNYRPFLNPGREAQIKFTNEQIYPYMDPMAEALRAAQREGVECNVWVTLFDQMGPPSELYGGSEPFPFNTIFQKAHPEYAVISRDQTKRQYGVLEYAYPAVRQDMLRFYEFYMQNYDLDGLYLSTRTHSVPAQSGDQFGFNEVIVQEYQNRYGIDILSDNRFNWANLFFNENDPVLENWRSLRGEYVTQFLRELRVLANQYGVKISIAIPQTDHMGPPIGNMVLDWRTWIQEGLIDELTVGHVTGTTLYPSYLQTRLHYLQIDEPGGISKDLTPLSEFRNFIDTHNPAVLLFYDTLYRTGTYNPQNFSAQMAYCDGLRFPGGINLHYSHVPTNRWWTRTLVYTDFDNYGTGNLTGQATQSGVWQGPVEHQVQTSVVYGESGKAVSSVRGNASTPSAYVDFGSAISEEAVEWSLWSRRGGSDSHCVYVLGANVSTPRTGFYVRTDGSICLYDGTGYALAAPAGTVAVGQWVRLRMYMNLGTGVLDAYYVIEGQAEEKVLAEDFPVSGTLADIRMLIIAPQPGVGNTTYTDNMQLFGVPAQVDALEPIGSPPPFPEWVLPSGGIRIAQNFDDTEVFSPGKDGPQGFDTDTSAVWEPIRMNNTPGIDNIVSYSGGQSLRIKRGSNPVTARVNIPLDDNRNYEARLWICRDQANSSALITVGNGTDLDTRVACRAWYSDSGSLQLYDNTLGSYVDSGLVIASQTWTQLKIKVNRTTGQYTALLMPDGQAEQGTAVSAAVKEMAGVNTIGFFPQEPDTAHVSHFDDVVLRESIDSCDDVWRLGYGYTGDVNQDCRVDIYDLAVLGGNWLRCNDPADSNCDPVKPEF